MGVSGLRKLIEDARNIDACMGSRVPEPIDGRLIIDGNDLLHELYRDFHLDWVHGGDYSRLRRAITDFFTALQGKGVSPIVVVDGGGEEEWVEESVYRKKLLIVNVPEERRKEIAKPRARHCLPILAKTVFCQTVTERKLQVPFCVADGKADKTVVELANHYACPALGCDNNYYIFNLNAGYIPYQHLKWRSVGPITARVFHQSAFAQHFGLRDPALCILLPALLGNGCDISLRYIYGAMKPLLDSEMTKCEAILKYARPFRSYQVFFTGIERLSLGWRAKEDVRNNCKKAERLYVVASTTTFENVMEKQPNGPIRLPLWLLEEYRRGRFLPSLLTATIVGRCPLFYEVGDESLPPPPALSKSIRQVTYGLLSGLSRPQLKRVKEYYRNSKPIDSELQYAEYVVDVIFDRFHELSVTSAESYTETEKDPFIRELFSSVLRCPTEVIDRLDNWEDRTWILPIAATRFWATKLKASGDIRVDQVVKALLLSFVYCHAQLEWAHKDSLNWSNPNCLPVHHTFLQWQCVWYDVVGLNQVLQAPFEAPSPASLFNGPLVLHYATHADPRVVDMEARSLSPENKQLFDKLLAAVLP